MLHEKDKVIVGVSGGADSICLLFMLTELQKELEFSIVAVHVHHGLRAESADADEEFVKRICKEQGIELVVFHEDVKTYARTHGLSEEEAGRDVRRAAFLQVKEEKQGTKIALAHHKNDNVETLLWNLCRGCGYKGIGGIAPVNGEWIRPLLCLQRAEIELYLEKMGISYCVDETNFENIYTRNRIRNEVIPYLENHINSQSVDHMAQMMEQMHLLGEYIDQEVEKYKTLCVIEDDEKRILQKEKFYQVPSALRRAVIHELLGDTLGQKKNIESAHIHMIEELLDKQVGRRCDLPYGVRAVRVYEGITFSKEVEKQKETGILKPRMRVFERSPQMVTFPENPYTKWFDYDIIKCTVEIRHRQSGDYITIDRNGKTQKLKQFFINEKIPQNIRDEICLVADGSEIMWIVGYRQNQAYQISDTTTTILEISFEE